MASVVKCDKCGAVEKSGIAGKQHRRCIGKESESALINNQERWLIRGKSKKIPRANRGKWQLT